MSMFRDTPKIRPTLDSVDDYERYGRLSARAWPTLDDMEVVFRSNRLHDMLDILRGTAKIAEPSEPYQQQAIRYWRRTQRQHHAKQKAYWIRKQTEARYRQQLCNYMDEGVKAMAGKGLSDLGLKDEVLPAQSFDDLPEFGGFTPPPQPGPYRFQLPGNLSRVWEAYDYGDKGQRLRMLLDKDAPLLIVQSPGGKANGDTFQTRISNQERKRGKDGPEASDMDYLLKAFGEKQRPQTNKAYHAAVLKYQGKEFGADLTYSFVCSDSRDIRVYDASGKLQPVEGQKGCGKRYYQKDIQRQEDGSYPHEIQCSCGGILRVFAGLENFRA